MKLRTILFLFAILGLAVFATGCCTSSVIDKSKQKTFDTFYPSAVYQATNAGLFAFEGSIHFSRPNRVSWDDGAPHRAYLIVSRTNFPISKFETNANLALNQIGKLSGDFARHLKPEKKLRPDFEKITDLPKNYVRFDLEEHHPNRGMVVLLPFSVAVDIATSPIQIPCYLLIAWAMGHSHGC